MPVVVPGGWFLNDLMGIGRGEGVKLLDTMATPEATFPRRWSLGGSRRVVPTEAEESDNPFVALVEETERF